MGYRLTRKELRIIEQTRLEGEAEYLPDPRAEGNGDGRTNPVPRKSTTKEILKPYLFFTLIFVAIALGVSVLVILTR